ncbi:MAG: methyltransferase domain-containing protein [Caldilineae bacterium]|nr:MAG: methyltransferase domain-containing protein [Caldilineae bacterium]
MSGTDFSTLADHYAERAVVQRSAGERLLDLLAIQPHEDVLDLGCGVGDLTRRIRELTRGTVVGMDASPGMIRQARERHADADIRFLLKKGEGLDDRDCYDVIYCNSVFQWFTEPRRVVANCYRALRLGGRMGVQAPAKRVYSPTFLAAVERVRSDPRTGATFAHFKEPWFLLETAEAYAALFEQAGFRVRLARIETVHSRHTPSDVFRVFDSGATAGYLNQACYDVPIDADYIEAFRAIVRRAFAEQAGRDGRMDLVFHRIYLLAVKERGGAYG